MHHQDPPETGATGNASALAADAEPAGAQTGPRPPIIAVAHQKGGSAKTTTACNLAVALAGRVAPQSVVVVDLDPQASASQSLRSLPTDPKEYGAYEVLTGRAGVSLHQVLQPTTAAGVLLLPAGNRLMMAELDGAVRNLSHRQFAEALTRDIGDVACVVLDCPPGFGVLGTLALMAADVVVIPTPPVPFAETALENTTRYMNHLRRNAGDRVSLILAMTRKDIPQHREVEARLRHRWRDKVLPTAIPFDPEAEAAIAAHTPVVVFRPGSVMARAYVAATEALIEAVRPTLDCARAHDGPQTPETAPDAPPQTPSPPPPPPSPPPSPAPAPPPQSAPDASPSPPPPPPDPTPAPTLPDPAPVAGPVAGPDETERAAYLEAERQRWERVGRRRRSRSRSIIVAIAAVLIGLILALVAILALGPSDLLAPLASALS